MSLDQNDRKTLSLETLVKYAKQVANLLLQNYFIHMKKEITQRIAKKLRKKLEESEELSRIYEVDYSKYYFRKILDAIFDDCNVGYERRLYSKAAVQLIREDLRKERETKNIFTDTQKAHIKKGAAEAEKQENLTDAALKGQITKEQFRENSRYYR